MSAKHTPGPWSARFDEAITIRDAVGNQLAILTHIKTLECRRRDLSEVEANARLISAAPELLEALKGVIRVADRATVEFDAARAAIAKAEGQS